MFVISRVEFLKGIGIFTVMNAAEISMPVIFKFLFYLISLSSCKRRYIIEDIRYKEKSLVKINEEIEKLSNLFSINVETLKIIFFKSSGNLNSLVDFINNSSLNLWSNIEDEIIVSNNSENIDHMIKARSHNEVMERKEFLNYIKDY